MTRRSGLSLLEVLVSFMVMALVVGSITVVYCGLLAGTRKSGHHQQAAARLETLCDLFELRAKENWPGHAANLYAPNPPDPNPFWTVEDTWDGYLYNVEDQGRVENPIKPGEYLEMKRLVVRIYYEDQNAQGQRETRSFATLLHVVK